MLGVGTKLTEGQVTPIRSIDPLLFQGCEPGTGNFLYCSLLGPSTMETPSCAVQFNVSWPKSPNNEEVFTDNASKLVALKLRARGFAPCLRNAIEGITEETPVSEIILADWQIHHWNSSERVKAGECEIPDVIQDFEREMLQRATVAILESRRACEDAHNWPVDQRSPLVTERKMPQQYA